MNLVWNFVCFVKDALNCLDKSDIFLFGYVAVLG